MTDFKSMLNDFSHLVSGMSSVAGNMRSEVEENMQSIFHSLISQAGFVKRDEFNILNDQLDSMQNTIEKLTQDIQLLKLDAKNINTSDESTQNTLNQKD